MARFVHVSDTHLGYQAYGRLSPEGLNQREVDVEDAFRRCVDWCLENRPDFVVHSGDLFDSPRPSNRAIAFALSQIRRLSSAQVPTILLSGNHDAPRLRETGHIFRIFDGIPHVSPIFRGPGETVRLETPDEPVVITGVPQAVRQELFQEHLANVEPAEGALNVLTVHGTVAGVEGLFTNELNDLLIPANVLDKAFDYVALGHFHGHRSVGPRAWYAGSTERTSIQEWDQEKSFAEVRLGKGGLVVNTRATGARPMFDAPAIDARSKGAEWVERELRSALDAQFQPGAIVRLVLDSVDRAVLRSIDLEAIRGAYPSLFHVQIQPVVAEETALASAATSLGPLAYELEAFLKAFPTGSLDRDTVRAEALRVLSSAGEATDAP